MRGTRSRPIGCGRPRPQLIAFFTSASIFFSSAAVSPSNANLVAGISYLDSCYVRLLGEPTFLRETYANGVRKAVYRDPDGNELGVRRRAARRWFIAPPISAGKPHRP